MIFLVYRIAFYFYLALLSFLFIDMFFSAIFELFTGKKKLPDLTKAREEKYAAVDCSSGVCAYEPRTKKSNKQNRLAKQTSLVLDAAKITTDKK
jgi:hypothetical protein